MIPRAAMGRLFGQKILLVTFVAMALVCGIHDIGYAQLPSFSDTEVSRSVAENSPTGTDIGDPVTADNFSSSTDRYRLAVPADSADSPDSDSFGIGSTTGQLTTNTELDFETKQTYKVVVIVERQQGGSWQEATSDSRSTVTINVTNVFEYAPLSDRTQQVVDEIVSKAPVSTAAAVTEAHLRAINWILINNKSISALKEKDFEGLTSMTALWLNSNDLTSLPENVFSGLPSLQQILLQYNQLASLPKNAFKGLSSLTTLRLEGNRLTSLPDGAFSGLTRLTKLHLNSNTADPVPLTISFVKIAEGEFKAVVPSGAPFRMVLHLDVENGTVDDGATTLTVAAGAVESTDSLTVTRIPGTTHAVTVDFADPLPSLPSDHKGYALTRSTDLPLSIITKLNSPPVFSEDVDAAPTIAENSMANVDIGTPLTAIDVDDDAVTYSLIAHADDADDYLAFTISSTTGQLKTKDSLDHETQSTYKVTVEAADVHGAFNTLDVTITLRDLYEYTPLSERTQEVVDEIVFRAPVSTASAVTEDHLEAITQLILNNELISSLKENDFEGLRSMQALWLNSNDLTSLPDNIFDGLRSLDTILLNDNALGSLDADVFSGLSSLKKLRLEGIQLTSLPATIFNGLSKLEEIHLNRNQLSSLPDGVFSGLTSLKQLYMNRNTVNPLPLTVSLVKVAEGQFKAVAPTGAPFRMVLHLTVTNGSIDGGATSATIPQGSVESRVLTMTRTPYTAAAVTVDIRNPLPRLPETHQGYAIRKSTDLPVTVIAEIPNNTPVFNTGLNTTPSIAENTAAGTNIGTALTATDADSTDTLTYSLKAHAEDTDDYLAFAIDSMGQLKTKDPLDYETQSTYKVTVAVTDNVVITTIDVTITITNVNEAPVFPTSETGARSIPDDIAADVNFGAAVAATDPDLTSTNTDANPETSTADTLTYSLSGDDAASFNIDTTTGQLKTKTGVTFDAAIKDTYNVTVTVTDGALSTSINVTITVVDAAQFNYAPIFNTGLNTTPSIAEHTGADTNIGSPLTATDADIADILTYSLKAHTDDPDDYLAFAIDSMGQLKTKANLDFEVQSTYKITVEVSDGTATATLDVTITITNIFEYTPLSERTQQVVDEIVREAPVSTASAVTEGHLEAIRKLLVNNENITALKEKDFEGLSSLGALWLYSNDLTSLPENVFSGLSNLTQLLLQYNQLTSLPENVFRGLSSLTTLRLEGNRLSSLPANLFAGHTKLTKLILRGNTVSPLPLTISFVKVAEGEFKAVVPSGAPFTMVLPLSVINGTVDGGATTFTVPAGAVESDNSLTVTRIPGTTHAVTVDFGESLPSLPSNHEGYALTKSAELPLAVIAALNSPPVFNADVNTMPTIAENTAAGENIGTPLTATDVDNDTVTYRLKAHADDADDYLAFSIDGMGQLKTKDPLNHEVQRRYRVTVEASDGKGGTADLDVTITLLDLYEYTLLSDRTQQVVDEIVFRAPVSTASAVTEDHLEAITFLQLNNELISALKEKDFEGLLRMQALWLNNNDLTSLPANIFSGLRSLDTLILNYNNQLSSLDANIFSGLSSLKKLRLEGLRLTSLPANIFNGLSRLQEIHLNYNRLSTLPDDVFSGLTSLTHLYMVGNAVSSLPLPVSLAKTGAGQFKAVAPTGAPFRMVLRLTVTNGSIDGGATSVVIAQGSVESNILTVTRTAGTTDAVTVDIGTPLPRLPASHQGYSIKKSSDLPLTVIDATETSPPVFNTGLNTTPEVVENTAADTNIGTPLTATDADTGDTLTYVLMAHSGDADDYLSFAIDENTGQLKTKDSIDYETQSTYKVMVQVSDGIFTTTIDVTITVTDVNEAPTFPADTDTRDVAENTMAGVNIGDPVAANEPDTADGDTDVNPDDPKVDALTYSLGGTDAASFGIDTGTGQLKTKVALDYETKHDYEVTVTVSDGGADTATVSVTINIIDVDDTPPTVEITGAITAQKDKFGITFTFSEAVRGFEANDISLTTTLTEGTGNATINKFTPVTGSDTQYTAEITPPTNADGSVAIQVPAGAAQDAAANGNTASSIFTVPMDTIIPSVTITAPMTKMGAFSVTITFSEDVTEFDNLLTDITLSDRAEATVTSLTGSGKTYTANIAPTSHGNLKISIPKNAAKDKANNGNTASQTHTVAIGLTGPSVAIQGVPTDPQNSAFTVTIIFSASVTGFTQSDISLGTGVSATVTSFTGSGTTYMATITPANNVEEEIVLSVPADAAQNDANMGNTASSEYPIQLDKVQPSVTVTAPATAVTVFDVTITFSENVTDFVQGDISFTGSTATAAVTDFTVENAKEYTATITPTSNGDVMISVPAGVAEDAAENQNTVSDISTVTVELNNAPAFDAGLNITPAVAENTAAGTNIGAPLTATDADTGATLTYNLKAHTDDADDYLAFAIDSMGQLKTKDPLDHETQSSYKIMVEVSDSVATATLNVIIIVTNVNEAPMFASETLNLLVSRRAAAGTVVETVAAADPDPDDTLTYSLSGTDASSFTIDSMDNLGQLGINTALTAEIGDEYMVTITVSDGGALADTVDVTITATMVPVCDRTQQVQDAIVAAVSGVTDCNDVTEMHLAAITSLSLFSKGITALKIGDFDGLTAMTDITLQLNELTSLPLKVFEGLTALTNLNLAGNKITTLPANVFAELSALTHLNLSHNELQTPSVGVFNGLMALEVLYLNNLHSSQTVTLPASLFNGRTALKTLTLDNNRLETLPSTVFSGLTALESLTLNNNELQRLPRNVFNGLTALEAIDLYNNDLTALEAGLFDGLSSLATLHLYDNKLTALPDGVFEGLSSLTALDLTKNPDATNPVSLDLTVSLEKVADGQFKAKVHTGAPFETELPLTVENGTIAGSVTAVTIAKGSVESSALTVTRTTGTTDAVTVNVGTLPSLPANHRGYKLVKKSTDLPLTVIVARSAPVFASDTASRSIAENTPANQTFGDVVTATDADTGDTLTYSLEAHTDAPTDVDLFDINATTGQLKTKDGTDPDFNFEGDKTSYTVVVKVTDSNDLTDTIDVTINVTDVNEAPTFPSTIDTTFEIAENSAAGENIGTAISATDPDTADGDSDVNPDDVNVDTLTYSLKDAADPTSDDAAFDIDAATGQLKTKAALDYETEPSYTVTVQVSDGEFTPTIDVTITITDVDEVQPTVTITGPTVTQKDKFEVTVTFSEGVTGFTASDISLTTTLTEGTGNATATLKNANDGDTVYTAGITPPTNAEGSIDIQVLAGVAQDNANLDNTASNTLTVAIDTKSPTVTITGPSGTQTGAFEITITFTEGVSGFTREDISLTDSTATATLKNATDGDSVYTAEVTPTTDGSVVFKVDADVAEDIAGNGNIASDALTVAVMLADPVDRPDPIMYVKQDGVVQHSQTVAVKPFELIIKFGQPVTGFEQSDLRLNNSGVTITGWVKSDEDKKYTVTVTPQAEGSVTFTVPENVTHAADDGEGNVQRKLYVKVDADHDPTAAVSEDETAPRVRTIKTPSGMQSSAFSVTITFTESVTGFTANDITLSGTANASVTTLTGSGSVYTATITPEANAAGDVVIQVSAGAVKDKAENENPASTTYSVRVNLTRPTVEIANVPTTPQNSAFSVAITFSKSVTGFEAGDIALSGTAKASVTALTGSGSVYTATITPTRSGEVSIQVRPNATRDSGNRGNVASSTHTVSADLTRPTVVITDVPTATQSGHFFVTITFSESVSGFTANDISLTNGTATLNRTGDSTFTASITPTSSGDVSIQVPENVAQDAAGNGNEVSQSHTVLANLGEDSGNVEIDNDLDPIMFVMQNGVEKWDQMVAPGTFQLIIDFGQPVTGFERSELSVSDFNTGVTITGWQRSSNGEDYIATVQVSNTGGLTFTVPTNAAQAVDDGRGNPERKLTVLVRESEHSGAPMVREGPPLPNETLLFSNYPNPFNPETWMPYQLAHDADVQILIYNVHGTVVRRLTLGYQTAGHYTSRDRAAHWDGRNSFGENVANGVYFYQLHAGDISPLRKMLILK